MVMVKTVKVMNRRNLSFDEIMIDIPQHEDVEKLSRTEFDHFIFRKNKQYFCGNCGCSSSMVETTDEAVICPNCHCSAKPKQITRRTNYDNMTSEIRVKVVQIYQGRIAFRGYAITQSISPESLREVITISEIVRETVYKGESRTFTNILDAGYKYQSWNYHLDYSKRWSERYLNENYRIRRPKKTFDIKPESYEKALSETELKYTGIGAYIDRKQKSSDLWLALRFAVATWIRAAAYYPWIEYLNKLGFTKLYEDVINFRADFRTIKPKYIMRMKSFIKQTNADSKLLICKNYVDKKRINISSESLLLVSKDNYNTKICLDRLKKMAAISKVTNMSIDKIINYITSQNDLGIMRFNYYEDYINTIIKTGLTPNTELIAFPRDLTKAHDDAVKTFNAIKIKLHNDQYPGIYKSFKKLNFTKGDLMIFLPDDVNLILKEGKCLHHCVGSYVEKVLTGKTLILFIRRVEKPNDPFYTLEYKNNLVIQCRGMQNSNTTPEVDKFIDEWLKSMKKIKQINKTHEIILDT